MGAFGHVLRVNRRCQVVRQEAAPPAGSPGRPLPRQRGARPKLVAAAAAERLAGAQQSGPLKRRPLAPISRLGSQASLQAAHSLPQPASSRWIAQRLE